MASISNTNILIKRSSTTATPGTLKAGEFAYSYSSNTLFLGNAAGTGVVNVGGLLYTQTIDAATNANTASTLVKRASDGSFAGQLYGNANTATVLQNSRNFSISGGDISAGTVAFDGSAAVVLNASLNSITGLTAGTYGGSTAIPVLQVAANGRVMAIANTALSTSFTVSGNTGSGTQNNGGTLSFYGNAGSGINTTVSGSGGNEIVVINTDSTIMRSNTSTVGPQTIGTDVLISGNLTVSGTATYVNTSIVQTTDSMIELAANNTVGDVIDIGFYGLYNNGASNLATGLVRDAGSKNYFLFSGISAGSISNANTIANNLFTASNTATLYANINANTANIVNATVSGTLSLTNALAVSQGGTGATTFTTGQRVVYSGTNLVSQANTGTAGTYGAASYVPIITTDAYGSVSSVSNTQIAIDTSQITSGTLGYSRGGTGSTSYTTGALLVAGASGLSSLANSTFTATGTGATNSTITSLTVDAYGRVTAATYSAISGLTVSQGGTGGSTFTTSGVLYGNGTGGFGVTAAAGTSDLGYSNQILTVNNSGTPQFTSSLDGGQF